jgi:hypothetical protein
MMEGRSRSAIRDRQLVSSTAERILVAVKVPQDATYVPQETPHVPQEVPHVPQETHHVPQETFHDMQVTYSGDLLAMFAAAALAFAFVVARRSETDPFHTWAACVTKVSPPLRGTSI